jgi:ribosomal protein L40E
MPELKPCWDCGHRLSPEATACTKCLSRYPFGVWCVICGKKLAYKDCLSWGNHGHPLCVAKAVAIPTDCFACGAKLPVLKRDGKELPGYTKEVCESCGQPNARQYISACEKCGLPMFSDNCVVRSGEDKYQRRSDYRYHAWCAPAEVKAPKGCATFFSVVAIVLLLLLAL